MNYNNGIQYNYEPQKVPTSYNKVKSPIILVCVAIVLIIVFFVDIILQIVLDFNPCTLVDDVAILTMAIIYLCYLFKCKSMNQKALGAATIIVCLLGSK